MMAGIPETVYKPIESKRGLICRLFGCKEVVTRKRKDGKDYKCLRCGTETGVTTFSMTIVFQSNKKKAYPVKKARKLK